MTPSYLQFLTIIATLWSVACVMFIILSAFTIHPAYTISRRFGFIAWLALSLWFFTSACGFWIYIYHQFKGA